MYLPENLTPVYERYFLEILHGCQADQLRRLNGDRVSVKSLSALSNLRNAMKLHFVDTMDQVLAVALEKPLTALGEEPAQPIAPITQPGEGPAAHQ